MTPQTDTPTWQELASGFRKLAESKPADLPPMVANRRYDAAAKPLWTFGFVPDKNTLGEFKRLCGQAAGKTGADPDYTIFLDTLKHTEHYHGYSENLGYIENVCEVAAEWCAEQAEQAGEKRNLQ